MESDAEINRILAERELYRRGNLDWLLHAGQRQIKERIFASKRQIQPILCSRGHGKTYLGAEIATETCIRKPSRVKIGTEFQTDLEEFILPNFHCVGAWARVHFKQLYYSVIVPTTMHRPDCKILLPTTPPETLDHFFWTLFDMVQLEEDIPIYTIDDNPLLTAADIARIETDMGGRESTEFKREYLCKRIAEASRQLTPEFTRERHTETWERPPYFKFLKKTSSLDTGVRHFTVQLYSAYDFPTATLRVERELILKQNEVLTDTIYDRTCTDEKELEYENPSRWADNNNLILLQDLNKKGFKDESGRYWSPTAKDAIEAGVNMVRTWLKNGRLKIDPACRLLIGTLETALWNKQRTDFAESEVYGHADALAALVYLIRNVDVATNPIPLTWSLDIDNSFFKNPNAPTGSAKVLADAFGLKRKP